MVTDDIQGRRKEGPVHPTKQVDSNPDTVRTYLRLTRLLDEVERHHPEVSGPLRLTLLRARRDGQIGSLDEDSFRAAMDGVEP